MFRFPAMMTHANFDDHVDLHARSNCFHVAVSRPSHRLTPPPMQTGPADGSAASIRALRRAASKLDPELLSEAPEAYDPALLNPCWRTEEAGAKPAAATTGGTTGGLSQSPQGQGLRCLPVSSASPRYPSTPPLACISTPFDFPPAATGSLMPLPAIPSLPCDLHPCPHLAVFLRQQLPHRFRVAGQAAGCTP